MVAEYARYAVYVVPAPGALAEFGAAVLGWDILSGKPREHLALPGLPMPVAALTERPAKYGFHGTIKPPFRLSDGHSVSDLRGTAAELLHGLPPVGIPGLKLVTLGRFFALVPDPAPDALAELAAQVVTGLDRFRAPLTDAERAKRQPERLTPQQRGLLDAWGYPYVLEEFRFHLTLTGPVPDRDLKAVQTALSGATHALVSRPLQVGSLCLCGERLDGRFEVIERFQLNG